MGTFARRYNVGIIAIALIYGTLGGENIPAGLSTTASISSVDPSSDIFLRSHQKTAISNKEPWKQWRWPYDPAFTPIKQDTYEPVYPWTPEELDVFPPDSYKERWYDASPLLPELNNIRQDDTWEKVAKQLRDDPHIDFFWKNVTTVAADTSKNVYFQLKNGVRVLLTSLPQGEPVTHMVVSFKFGYREDPEFLPGLSHFLEHMLFRRPRVVKDLAQVVGSHEWLKAKGGIENGVTTHHTMEIQRSVVEEFEDALLNTPRLLVTCFALPESDIWKELQAIENEIVLRRLEHIQNVLRSVASLTPGHAFYQMEVGAFFLKRAMAKYGVEYLRLHAAALALRKITARGTIVGFTTGPRDVARQTEFVRKIAREFSLFSAAEPTLENTDLEARLSCSGLDPKLVRIAWKEQEAAALAVAQREANMLPYRWGDLGKIGVSNREQTGYNDVSHATIWIPFGLPQDKYSVKALHFILLMTKNHAWPKELQTMIAELGFEISQAAVFCNGARDGAYYAGISIDLLGPRDAEIDTIFEAVETIFLGLGSFVQLSDETINGFLRNVTAATSTKLYYNAMVRQASQDFTTMHTIPLLPIDDIRVRGILLSASPHRIRNSIRRYVRPENIILHVNTPGYRQKILSGEMEEIVEMEGWDFAVGLDRIPAQIMSNFHKKFMAGATGEIKVSAPHYGYVFSKPRPIGTESNEDIPGMFNSITILDGNSPETRSAIATLKSLRAPVSDILLQQKVKKFTLSDKALNRDILVVHDQIPNITPGAVSLVLSIITPVIETTIESEMLTASMFKVLNQLVTPQAIRSSVKLSSEQAARNCIGMVISAQGSRDEVISVFDTYIRTLAMFANGAIPMELLKSYLSFGFSFLPSQADHPPTFWVPSTLYSLQRNNVFDLWRNHQATDETAQRALRLLRTILNTARLHFHAIGNLTLRDAAELGWQVLQTLPFQSVDPTLLRSLRPDLFPPGLRLQFLRGQLHPKANKPNWANDCNEYTFSFEIAIPASVEALCYHSLYADVLQKIMREALMQFYRWHVGIVYVAESMLLDAMTNHAKYLTLTVRTVQHTAEELSVLLPDFIVFARRWIQHTTDETIRLQISDTLRNLNAFFESPEHRLHNLQAGITNPCDTPLFRNTIGCIPRTADVLDFPPIKRKKLLLQYFDAHVLPQGPKTRIVEVFTEEILPSSVTALPQVKWGGSTVSTATPLTNPSLVGITPSMVVADPLTPFEIDVIERVRQTPQLSCQLDTSLSCKAFNAVLKFAPLNNKHVDDLF